jgi:hypothetical protein
MDHAIQTYYGMIEHLKVAVVALVHGDVAPPRMEDLMQIDSAPAYKFYSPFLSSLVRQLHG